MGSGPQPRATQAVEEVEAGNDQKWKNFTNNSLARLGCSKARASGPLGALLAPRPWV